ncbi:MAG: beta-ketoacyl synthase [Candidatus Rickettsiella isopodorum]|nr:beta-ketoacyl synthase [Flavobacterium sp.]
MMKLPLIVGIGGINAAGRSSGFHSYKRLMPEVFSEAEMQNTWMDLANRMKIAKGNKLNKEMIEEIKRGTLIRRIDSFDPDKVKINLKAYQKNSFIIHKTNLPKSVPPHWLIEEKNNEEITVTVPDGLDILIPVEVKLGVSCGANIPHGFDPSDLYSARSHPLSIKMTVYGASDALHSLGFSWDEILNYIDPDEISVYAGSAISQVDEFSLGGLIKQPLLGHRVSSKMLALSLPQMPADFINSYIINSVGNTGANIGACASFLYNLKQGVVDIQTGKAKVVIVGSADAPLVPEIIEGFKSMKALATDAGLQALDKKLEINCARACRPFSSNCGFVVANASQFIVLMAPELALQLGAKIYGSVPDVFINADANKKSISAPGIGNYVTFAKATALAKAILGSDKLQETFVQAHGTGTPQNRVTESHIINEVAKTFGLNGWMVTAVKSYVGHSFGAASGDQILTTLGTWQHGWIPGIKTIDHIAEDVYNSHIDILMEHTSINDRNMEAALINSKGFGGNNATALVLSPNKTHEILKKKFKKSELQAYERKNQRILAVAESIDNEVCKGKEQVIYQFGDSLMDKEDVKLTQTKLMLSKFKRPIHLNLEDPYQ